MIVRWTPLRCDDSLQPSDHPPYHPLSTRPFILERTQLLLTCNFSANAHLVPFSLMAVDCNDTNACCSTTRLLAYWYTRQQMFVRWQNIQSECFGIANDVRQGCLLLPFYVSFTLPHSAFQSTLNSPIVSYRIVHPRFFMILPMCSLCLSVCVSVCPLCSCLWVLLS